jgi:hypothetical protein
MLAMADDVYIMLSVANSPAQICLKITKTSIRDFIRLEGADPTDADLWSWIMRGTTLYIQFAT